MLEPDSLDEPSVLCVLVTKVLGEVEVGQQVIVAWKGKSLLENAGLEDLVSVVAAAADGLMEPDEMEQVDDEHFEANGLPCVVAFLELHLKKTN